MDEIRCNNCGSWIDQGKPCPVCQDVAKRRAALDCSRLEAHVARGMAAAFHRGYCKAMEWNEEVTERVTTEMMEKDWPGWIAAAKSAISMASQ